MDMPSLTFGQYQLVYNMLSFTFATMLASFVFFILARQQVGARYRGALLVSALVVGIAAYHYLRIFESWAGAFTLGADGMYNPSGEPFNDAYRYVDWLLTVPLLMVELVAVLALSRSETGKLLTKLVIAATLMIVLGYPGEIATDNGTRALWGFLSTIPFVYILYVLWIELGSAIQRQPENVKVLIRNIRLLLLATWGFYPIAYMLPFLGIAGGTAEVGLQLGYSIADVAAKAGYGVMIYWIARLKTEADEAEAGVSSTVSTGAGAEAAV